MFWVIIGIGILAIILSIVSPKKDYEKQYLKIKNKFSYDQNSKLNQYIIEIFDKNNLKDFYNLCKEVYVPKFLNIIIVECTPQVAKLLDKHPNVISIREASVGNFTISDITESKLRSHKIEV